MFKGKIIKTPFNSRKKLIKNFSCGNYDSQGKTIFKIQDRLFSSNTLSLLSKNIYRLSRNYIDLLRSPSSTSKENLKSNKYRFKSSEVDKKFKTIYPYTHSKIQKISFSTIDENKNKKELRQSYLNLQNMNKIKKKDSQIILPKVLRGFSFGKNGEWDNPRKFLQINRVLKFSLARKKEEIEKDLTPMKLGNDYVDFIEKKNKIFFNPNFNSPFIHKMNSNYLIDKNFLKKIKSGFSITKLKTYTQEKLEKDDDIELESKDKMEEMSLDLQHYKKAIKIFLTDETKLNQIYIHEEFFDSFPNKINFLFDDRKFPTIKNNLNKIKVEIKTSGGYEWNRLNMIELSTLTYLHKLKAKIQRELDEIEENENKEKQFKINQEIGKYDYKNNKKKKKKKKLNKSQETEKTEESKSLIIDNKNIFKIKEKGFDEEENEEAEEEKIENKEDLYEFEEFFIHKGRPYKIIDFAKGKSAYTVYNNPNFYKEDYFKIEFDKEDKNIIKNKKEVDLYL